MSGEHRTDSSMWIRRKALFAEVIDLADDERTTYLDAACADDDELRRQVETLLEHDRQLDAARSSADDASNADDGHDGDVDDASAGFDPAALKLERYDIDEFIGQGNMGVVYQARHKPTGRRVALKLLRGSLMPGRSNALMRREAQALGRLQHGEIAQVIDAGAVRTPLGKLPYIAMEFADGQPITDFAAGHELSIEQRLRLCARVCRAVHYAHLQGVIHRDLKPGHILVDEHGQLKIIDFGVARLLEADGQPMVTQSEDGRIVGTLPYMSPEQLAGEARSIDHRSDVYALGVLLYQLLSGQLPIDIGTESIVEAARIVRSTAPTPLGQASRSLRGDLETIVHTALSKDVTRRYESAGALADDVDRYLHHQPIRARPLSRLYLARRFVQRNRTVVAAAAVVFAVLIGAVIVMAMTTNRARQAEREATARFADVRELANTLIFDVHDSIAPLEGSTAARQMIVDSGLSYLDVLAEHAPDDDQLQLEVARGYIRLGEVQGYHYRSNLGDLEGAAASFRQALDILEPMHERRPGDVEVTAAIADATEGLASVDYSTTGKPSQQMREQILQWRKEVVLARPTSPSAAADVANAYKHLASQVYHLEDGPQFDKVLRDGIDYAQNALDRLGPDKALRLELIHLLFYCGLYRWKNELDDFMPTLERARSECEALIRDDPNMAGAKLRLVAIRGTIGRALAAEGSLEAVEHTNAALELARQCHKSDPTNHWAHRTWSVLLAFSGEVHEKLAETADLPRAARLDHLQRALSFYERNREQIDVRIEQNWLGPWESHYPQQADDAIARLKKKFAELSGASGPLSRCDASLWDNEQS